MIGKAFSVDLNKPLAFQVGHLGEDYDEWVHQPILSKGSPRLFENDFIEWFTQTRWWVVPLFWLPISWWFILKNDVPGRHVAAATVAVGVILWTLIEYCLHRFLLHIKTTGYWGNTFHYLIHGCHHKHPMDNLRLVLPPPLAALFVFTFWNLTKLIIPAPYCRALFGGELLGYVVYDCTHYFLHYAKPLKPGLFHQLKRHHMNHHFRIEDKLRIWSYYTLLGLDAWDTAFKFRAKIFAIAYMAFHLSKAKNICPLRSYEKLDRVENKQYYTCVSSNPRILTK